MFYLKLKVMKTPIYSILYLKIFCSLTCLDMPLKKNKFFMYINRIIAGNVYVYIFLFCNVYCTHRILITNDFLIGIPTLSIIFIIQEIQLYLQFVFPFENA